MRLMPIPRFIGHDRQNAQRRRGGEDFPAMIEEFRRQRRNPRTQRQHAGELLVIRLKIRRVIRNAQLLINDGYSCIMTSLDHHHRTGIGRHHMNDVWALTLNEVATLLIISPGESGDYAQRPPPNKISRAWKSIEDFVSELAVGADGGVREV